MGFSHAVKMIFFRVNFKKNEKNYTPQNSEVFKMVQEADKEPRTPEPG